MILGSIHIKHYIALLKLLVNDHSINAVNMGAVTNQGFKMLH